MKKSYLLLLTLFTLPTWVFADTAATPVLKEKVSFWRAFKRQARSAPSGPTCDTLILKYGTVLVGRIKYQTADYVNIVLCDHPSKKERRISRDVIVDIRRGDFLAQKKGLQPALGNRFALALGILSIIFWILLLTFLESLILFLDFLIIPVIPIPLLLGIIALILGILNIKKPEANKGRFGIILGGISIIIAFLIALPIFL